MRESELERKLTVGIKHLGGIAYKFTSPGNAGVPDRIVVLPNGKTTFVEMKAEKGELSSIQKVQIKRLLDRGQEVFVIKGEEELQGFLSCMFKRLKKRK